MKWASIFSPGLTEGIFLSRYSIWLDSKLRLHADPMLIIEYFLWRKKAEYAISMHYVVYGRKYSKTSGWTSTIILLLMSNFTFTSLMVLSSLITLANCLFFQAVCILSYCLVNDLEVYISWLAQELTLYMNFCRCTWRIIHCACPYTNV